jgi:hypothetical protein
MGKFEGLLCFPAIIVNPNDLAGGSPKILDLHFDVKFAGIYVSLLEKMDEVMHAAVTGED